MDCILIMNMKRYSFGKPMENCLGKLVFVLEREWSHLSRSIGTLPGQACVIRLQTSSSLNFNQWPNKVVNRNQITTRFCAFATAHCCTKPLHNLVRLQRRYALPG